MHLSASLCHMRPVQASASIVVWSLSRPPSHFQCFLWGPGGAFNVSYGARLGVCGVPFRYPRDFFVLFFCPRIQLLLILLFDNKNASWGSSSLVSGGPLTAKKCDSVRNILQKSNFLRIRNHVSVRRLLERLQVVLSPQIKPRRESQGGSANQRFCSEHCKLQVFWWFHNSAVLMRYFL